MRKNILLISADQFRHDALGIHGAFPVQTPNLDRLAKQGCLFENTYCANPLCVPSRASIMTGQNCHEHGVYYNDLNWAGETPTIPSLLAENGYHCLKVGKTHFNPKNSYRGFHKIVLDRDLSHHFDDGVAESSGPGWAGVLERQYGERKAATVRETYEPVVHCSRAIQELQRLLPTRRCRPDDPSEPFFLWLSFRQPHTPCNPPEPYRSMYYPENMRQAIASAQEMEKFAPMLARGAKCWTTLDDNIRRSFMARYLGSITLLDELIGDLLSFLEGEGLMENTLIVFTSDHGDYLGDHHRQQKGFFHDCSTKVPLIFSGPQIATGRKIRQNCGLVDLLPTLLDYCALLMPDCRDASGHPIYNDGLNLQGRSLLGAMNPADASEENQADNRVIVSETGIYGQGIMLKQGATKVNYYPKDGWWDHFETDRDPDELDNLGGTARPPLSNEMLATLNHVLERSARFKDRKYFFEKVRPFFS